MPQQEFVFLALHEPFLLLCLCLPGILSMIIIRTLRKDIANYNRDDDIVRKYKTDQRVWSACLLQEIVFIFEIFLPVKIWFLFRGSVLVFSKQRFSLLTRKTRWRSRDGRTSMAMSSDRRSIPWSSAPCWAQGSSFSAWSSLSSVSLASVLFALQNFAVFEILIPYMIFKTFVRGQHAHS